MHVSEERRSSGLGNQCYTPLNGLYSTQIELSVSLFMCVFVNVSASVFPNPTRHPPCYFTACLLASRHAHGTGTNPGLKQLQTTVSTF